MLDDSVRNESVIELLSDDDGPTQPVDLITSNSQPLDLTTPTKRRRRTTAIQQSRFPAGITYPIMTTASGQTPVRFRPI